MPLKGEVLYGVTIKWDDAEIGKVEKVILRKRLSPEAKMLIAVAVSAALDAVRREKPGDRSARDRVCAVTITELEKARSLAQTFLLGGKWLRQTAPDMPARAVVERAYLDVRSLRPRDDTAEDEVFVQVIAHLRAAYAYLAVYGQGEEGDGDRT